MLTPKSTWTVRLLCQWLSLLAFFEAVHSQQLQFLSKLIFILNP